MIKHVKHQLGEPWPPSVLRAVADDWVKHNRFASAALGTVTWTLMGAYYFADWGARSLWSTTVGEETP